MTTYPGSRNPNWKGGELLHSCEVCEKEYSDHNRKSKYCSGECRGKAQQRRILKVCENCEIEFETNKAYEKRITCCSLKCKYELMKKKHDVPVSCKGCEIEFSPKRKQRSDGKKIINKILFHSVECLLAWRKQRYKGKQNPRWLGGTTAYRGPDWDTQRKKATKRDNYTCQLCLCVPEVLPVHHIVPYRITKDNRLCNLISLCNACHGTEENDFRRFNKPSLKIRTWLKGNMIEKIVRF